MKQMRFAQVCATVAFFNLFSLFSPEHLLAGSDLDLALAALREIGANVPDSSQRCSQCHSLNAETISTWGQAMQKVSKECMENSALAPYAKITCLTSSAHGATYHPSRLGLWAAFVDHPKFKQLFLEAYGPNEAESAHQIFARNNRMPPANENPMSPEAFTKVELWVNRGMPALNEALMRPPSLPKCEDSTTPELKSHISSMIDRGWSALNQERMMRMFACNDANPLNCFNQTLSSGAQVFPLAQDIEAMKGWVKQSSNATYRVLARNFNHFYWVRSSSEGRFVGGPDFVIDLAAQLASPRQPIRSRIALPNGRWDPNFFPDNSGFSYLNRDQVPVFCPYRLLEDTSITGIDITNIPCTTFQGTHPYLFLGGSLDNSDYFALTGHFTNDRGNTAGDPHANFGTGSRMFLTWIRNNGQTFDNIAVREFPTPYEGDWALSQSGLLAAGRLSANNVINKHHGYTLRTIHATNQGGSYEMTATPAGRVCLRGGKANFSFNERSMIVHHHVFSDEYAEYGYTSQNDPNFKHMVDSGTANIYVADLLTNQKVRLTTMQPGQRALYPHFRSDGWLYFLVDDKNLGESYMVATDAVIRMWNKSTTK